MDAYTLLLSNLHIKTFFEPQRNKHENQSNRKSAVSLDADSHISEIKKNKSVLFGDPSSGKKRIERKVTEVIRSACLGEKEMKKTNMCIPFFFFFFLICNWWPHCILSYTALHGDDQEGDAEVQMTYGMLVVCCSKALNVWCQKI